MSNEDLESRNPESDNDVRPELSSHQHNGAGDSSESLHPHGSADREIPTEVAPNSDPEVSNGAQTVTDDAIEVKSEAGLEPSEAKTENNGISPAGEEDTPTVEVSAPQINVDDVDMDDTADVTTESHIEPATGHGTSHSRRHSTLSLSSTATMDNLHIFKNAFDYIMNSKEAKKDEAFKATMQKAMDSLNDPHSRNPHIIFDALQEACKTPNNTMKAKALDLFSKLFDYTVFEDAKDKVQLTDASVDVISSCFDGEGTDPEVELQVVRSLMNSVLLMPCHGAALLKAVRQIYNVFIFSLSPRNQAVAQGILTQVISSIFRRISDTTLKSKKLGSSTNLTSPKDSKDEFDAPNGEDEHNDDGAAGQKLTLENLERLNNSALDSERVQEANQALEGDEDLFVKDAFLIFRSMCKLSVKPIDSETTIDMKSHSVRSKLLSLHIVHTILKEHIDIFLSKDVVILSSNSSEQTRLINAVRQYLCLTLSRNAASPLAPVFELSLEIFWLIISNLRSEFKQEIPVFWDEIYLPVAEMRTSTAHQKRYLLSIIERLCNDSRCIIEFYLNYDCDSTMPSICEKIVDLLTKLSLSRIEVTPQQRAAFYDNRRKGISVYDISKIANLTSSTMSSKPPEPDVYNMYPLEFALKITALSCNVALLRSLYSWAQKGITFKEEATRSSHDNTIPTPVLDSSKSTAFNSRNASFINGSALEISDVDDPEQFENLKQRKKAFLEGVKLFNQKAKKGIEHFLQHHFIPSDSPKDIAKFLLETEGLDKAVIGEYMGEGNEQNVAVMHAFVDQMDFADTDFVQAMRTFLQSFRLPGESQKIDRYMLKFAERYVQGNPSVFANAETAYVLSYSVILLNTDLHSPQIKNRMTVESFIKNNSGIDNDQDLPRELLEAIYREVQDNEIVLVSEQYAALLAGDIQVQPSGGLGLFGGRDLNKEAYSHASKEMATKTEKLVRDLGKKLKAEIAKGVFYAASNVYHVKSIFDTIWMSILAGLTQIFKEYDDSEISRVCLEGIRLSIKISCMFDLDYARKSFLGALVQFENLHSYEEMKEKNVDAIYMMLDLAVSEGNYMKSAWMQVLTSVSQLERLQLIAQGIDQNSIPDVSTAKLVNRTSTESNQSAATSFFSLFTSHPTASQTASNKFHNQRLTPHISQLLTKTELEVAVDKVFTNSSNLSGEAIADFVRALSEVSSEEIDSSGQSSNPRMFSLQKIVDICYYNMGRIRLEWSQLWAIIGEIFNRVGCHSNLAIVFFALDSLRQLSMRFFEIEELSHFKFQKEFLKPFEHIVRHNESLEVKDMVLECINNMILARSTKIRSGWKTIFGTLSVTAKENKETLVNKSFKMANWINKEYIDTVRQQESFADLVVCFTELAKNEKFQRISLLSLDVLRKLIKEIPGYTNTDANDVISDKNDNLVKLWFPILFGFYDITMTGEELEVRSRALNALFDILLEYGEHFENNFWDLVCRQLLFPIFGVLSNHWELNNIDDNDKLSVWLSTTLIQALRNMVTVFTHYFDALNRMLDEYLNLFISCICQENDTIARIGRSCLHSLLIENASKFDQDQWNLITKAVHDLYDLTTAKELFTADPMHSVKEHPSIDDKAYSYMADEVEIDDTESLKPAPENHINDTEARLQRSRDKSSIVVKCVLQLLMIETLSELFKNDHFYEAVPYTNLLQMAGYLRFSYDFAKRFNDDYELRVRIWNAGVIERLPNLLKQESSSAAVFINIMLQMYCDDDKTDNAAKAIIMKQIIPLSNNIIDRFTEFDETNQQRNITTWKPVIIEIYQGYIELDEEDFVKYSPEMYQLTLQLFTKSISTDLRGAIRTFLTRIGDTFVKSS